MVSLTKVKSGARVYAAGAFGGTLAACITLLNTLYYLWWFNLNFWENSGFTKKPPKGGTFGEVSESIRLNCAPRDGRACKWASPGAQFNNAPTHPQSNLSGR